MVELDRIHKLSEDIVRGFRPERIILFGSHARGDATEESDVDLLVIVRSRCESARKAAEILNRTNPRFPVDLIVRSTDEVSRRAAQQDWFILEVLEQGKVLYETPHKRVGRKGRG